MARFKRMQDDPEFKKRMEERRKEREAEEAERQRQQAWKDKWK